jgi:hypothetical protein
MASKSERAKGKIQLYNENVRYQDIDGSLFNFNIDDYLQWDKFRFQIYCIPHMKTEIDIPVSIANQIAMWILAKSLPDDEIEKLCKNYGFNSDAFKGLNQPP